jgi:Carboxypeptidase regulatory-like domain
MMRTSIETAARRRVRVLVGIAVLTLALGRGASAQHAGVVTGIVDDDTKSPLAGAAIVLEPAGGGRPHETVTDRGGHFEFTGVPPGDYVVRASLDGFQTARKPVTVGAEALRPLAIRLKVSNAEEVTVVGHKAGDPLSPESNADAVTLDADQIRALPSESQDILPLLMNFISPAAAATGVAVVVDGIEGNSLSVPASAIKRLTINRNPYSAQFRGAGKARIEVVTDHGSRRLFHGGVAMFVRNSALDARNAFALTTPSLDRRHMEATLGGPLPGKGFSFYFTGERLIDNDSAVVNAELVDGPLVNNAAAPRRRTNLIGGMDWRRHKTYELSLRYSYFDEAANGQGIGGLVLANQGYRTADRVHQLVVGNHIVLSDTFVNDLRFAFTDDQTSNGGPAAGPQVIVAGAFSAGPSQLFTAMRAPSTRVQDVATIVRGPNTITLGGSIRPKVLHETDASNFGGTFTFADLTQFASGRPSLYRVNAGSPSATFDDDSASAYLEDSIRVGPQVSITAGVRDDWQTRLGHSWGPRLAFAFAPGNKATVFRGGAGLFSDRLHEGAITRTVLTSDDRLRQFVIADPTYPTVSAADLVLRRATLDRLAAGLRTPQSLQAGVSVDRQLWPKATMTLEYQYLRGYDLFRSRNINAPLPDTGSRPDPAFLNIYQVESTGDRRGHSASATFNGRLWHFKTIAQYTWSHVQDNTDDARFLPADNYNLQPEWGPADFDRRDRFSLMATREWNDGAWRAGPILMLASGLPYNITTGFDNNNDSLDNDRPAGVTRNTGRAPGLAQLDLRVTRVLRVGGPLNAGDAQAQTVEFSMDAFNVLNHTNVSQVVGVTSSPLFGQPVQASKARTLQFSMRYRF